MRIAALLTILPMAVALASGRTAAQTHDLSTSKQLIEPVPGHPQKINSLPMSIAISPDKRYVDTINAGFGTAESNYDQSLSVLDTQTGQIADFPDARTLIRMKQTLYSGLAFSRDGLHIYASIGSLTDPEGTGKDDTGSGIVVYGFAAGKVTPERIIRLPLEKLGPGHTTRLIGEKDGDQGVPFPAAIEVVGAAGAEKLLVAENYSD